MRASWVLCLLWLQLSVAEDAAKNKSVCPGGDCGEAVGTQRMREEVHAIQRSLQAGPEPASAPEAVGGPEPEPTTQAFGPEPATAPETEPAPEPSPTPDVACEDDESWFFKLSGKKRTCAWLATQSANKRIRYCKKKGKDNINGNNACPETCDNCPTPSPPTPTPAPQAVGGPEPAPEPEAVGGPEPASAPEAVGGPEPEPAPQAFGPEPATAPETEPAPEPSPTPDVACEDDESWWVKVNGKKKPCAWLAATSESNRKKYCKKKGKGKVNGNNACPEACDTCPNGPDPSPTPSSPEPSPTPSLPSPEPSPTPDVACEDDESWFFKLSGKKRTCAWIAKQTASKQEKYCTSSKKGKDKTKAKNACKKTCDNCDRRLAALFV